LSGKFGAEYKNVDRRFVCLCYAVDRLITYRDEIKKYYDDDYLIICDRWVTANMLHQATSTDNNIGMDDILNFINDLEYNSFKLPKPDLTLFLKVPYEYSYETCINRIKDNGCIKNDIHEKDIEFMKQSYENSIYVCNKYNWNVIECYKEGMKSIDEIHQMIYKQVKNILR